MIGPSEANDALDARSLELLASLRVCSGDSLDERNLECKKLERQDIELLEADGWSPSTDAHLHFTWTFKLGFSVDQVSALRLEDRDPTPGVVTSEVVIAAPPTQPLIVAGDGAHSGGLTRDFNWIEAGRAPGPRVVVARWQTSKGPRWAAVVGVTVMVAFALVIARYWVRRR